MRNRLLTLTIVLCTNGPVLAWNDHGHMLVALIAWDQMEEEQSQRNALLEILREHPHFQQDFLDRMPQIRDSDRNRWLFAQAATWPDIARDYEEYHRGTWHYINEPIFLTRRDEAFLRPRLHVNLKTKYDPQMNPLELNALQALELCQQQLADERLDKGQRAIALCWILHLIGDLHQPLHTSALFTRQLFRGGDHGGNYITLEGNGYDNLHKFWDGSAGSGRSLGMLTREVRDLLAQEASRSAGREAAGELRAKKWVDEGHTTCLESVYDDAILEEVREAERGGRRPRAIALSNEYVRTAREVAKEQVVKGGFRLAATLRSIRVGGREERRPNR